MISLRIIEFFSDKIKSLFGLLNLLTTVVILVVTAVLFNGNQALAANGIDVNFDIQPRTVGPVRIVLRMVLFRTTLENYCSDIIPGRASPDPINWTIMEKLPNGQLAGFPGGTGSVNLSDFTGAGPSVDLSFDTSIAPRNAVTSRPFFVVVNCSGFQNKQITQSLDVIVNQSGGGGGGGGGGGTNTTVVWKIPNPLGPSSVDVFAIIFRMTNWVLNIAASLLVILIIYSGIKFMLSPGNPGEIQRAKNILFWALAGFAITMIGKGFVFIIDNVLRGGMPI